MSLRRLGLRQDPVAGEELKRAGGLATGAFIGWMCSLAEKSPRPKHSFGEGEKFYSGVSFFHALFRESRALDQQQ